MKYITFALTCLTLAVFLSGCGDKGGPDPTVQAKSVENAKNLRSYFDKAGGNYDSLSAADKEAFVKASGGQEKATQNWNLMANGPGAGRAGTTTGQ